MVDIDVVLLVVVEDESVVTLIADTMGSSHFTVESSTVPVSVAITTPTDAVAASAMVVRKPVELAANAPRVRFLDERFPLCTTRFIFFLAPAEAPDRPVLILGQEI
ncbi:hypothetical protein FHS91_003899 [Sphingobium xanthum]|uniref:hypothetical protein n=1 Tax=Sphingobium xanthum TaxID=1387165 RepID=UPI001C8C8801|nr:hypothetical protein [Sphingobium xanthum]